MLTSNITLKAIIKVIKKTSNHKHILEQNISKKKKLFLSRLGHYSNNIIRANRQGKYIL